MEQKDDFDGFLLMISIHNIVTFIEYGSNSMVLEDRFVTFKLILSGNFKDKRIEAKLNFSL